jgi:antibiotic biosynthesis monooxygenase (ABM) superfamily enzyme
MSIPTVFWCLVVLFAVIGSLRGWAKELLVGCALVLALFINLLIDKYAAPLLTTLSVQQVFLVRAGVFCVLAYFGYLTPRLPWISSTARCWSEASGSFCTARAIPFRDWRTRG